ncbi:MAG: ankyrin repeat domain-containing protein [Dechloromonas sp.]|nr:ankyrin repeat domain-containing protein [Dechloromonas sp.]
MGSNSFGASPLIEAIRANSLPRVIAALEDGGDVEEKDIHGYAGLPLRTACFSGNVPIIRELLKHGADVNAPTADGPGAPLRAAMRAGNTEIVAMLLSHDAQIPFGLEIPMAVYERAKELTAGNTESLDVPMLEFERHDLSASVSNPAAEKFSAKAFHDNVIEFSTPEQNIEKVDLRGVYGMDTSVLALDFERASGAWEKVEGVSKNETT